MKALAAKILQRTKRLPNGCRVWLGATDQKGYGQIRFRKRLYRVHRVMWSVAHGKIPIGRLVCHKCDRPPCVEKKHLFCGTAKDNTADMTAKGRARGRFRLGHITSNRKFTESRVRCMRTEYATGRLSQVGLAKLYNTSQGYISNIILGRTWRLIK